MHIKLEVTASLPTHRIARSLWVPEFYTLEELANVLRAALGWEAVSSYCFRSGDTTWLPCDELENDIVEDGQFLAEGTTFSEVLNLWDADGTIFQTGKSEIWEFNIHIREVRETHPDNLTCILLDGQGDMPVNKDEMRKIFLDVHEKICGDGDLLMSKSLISSHQVEQSLGHCAELVSYRSYEISRARRIPQY